MVRPLQDHQFTTMKDSDILLDGLPFAVVSTHTSYIQRKGCANDLLCFRRLLFQGEGNRTLEHTKSTRIPAQRLPLEQDQNISWHS